MTKKSIIDEYLDDYHNVYCKKYGQDTTIIMMQVGSFYEAYSTDTEGPNLQKISEILNIICTRRDKNEKIIDRKNPYMMGFPVIVENKFIKLLIENNYTIIIVDKISNTPPYRGVRDILSAGTYIENINIATETNFMLCVYFDKIISKQKIMICCGITAINILTGKVYIHEVILPEINKKIIMDDILRFINGLNPREVLIYNYSTNILSKDYIVNYLDLNNNKKLSHYTEIFDINKYLKIGYQIEILNIVYKKYKSLVPIIEILGVSHNYYIIICMVLLIDFIFDHNNKLLIDLDLPKFYLDNSHLLLGNNAIQQLNIIDNGLSYGKYKSLMDIINIASTNIGKRYIRDILISPMIDKEVLTKIYNNVEYIIKQKIYDENDKYMKNLIDFDRIKKKISLKILNPYELYEFINSLNTFNKFYLFIKEHTELKEYCNIRTKKLDNFIKYCDKTFNLDILKIYSLIEIKENIYNKGIHIDIDNIQKSKDNEIIMYEKSKDKIQKLLNIKTSLKLMQKDNFYITLTAQRGKLLESKKIDFDEYNIENISKNGKHYKIIFKNLTTNDDNLSHLIKAKYLNTLEYIYTEYNDTILDMIKFIESIDYLNTIARVSVMHNYSKPIIKQTDGDSYVKAKNLRHPIIEQIIDVPYIPHDIYLGHDLKGMLIYGINSSGKSSLMKAVGINIIMAQSGFFVAAEEFEFNPYHSIYTRISTNDNIFKGLSSFMIEILELDTILKGANNKTLIIGDEIASSTESISANAIITSTILELIKQSTSFIFTSHFHELQKLDEIKNLKSVKAYHLSVKYLEDNKLVFERKLKDGSGDSIYGLQVMSFIINNPSFVKTANEIKNKLMDNYGELVQEKNKSKYNSKVYITACAICNEPNKKSGYILDTHHINYQENCKDGFVIDKSHIKKNSKQNLIVLCKKCHKNIHAENKEKNYVMSSQGKVLV